ncbi:hypothetical protein GIB67_023345 [Kingdonia uniflora]|uniref:SHSP domain-containing protein n=1 Tax=Kingdonia uniflora TaxID=39325 RepID=A0A7J7LIH9_9MAGN|nr:hypothetical protein GIB67_023345 [Kingdonia uniflora]
MRESEKKEGVKYLKMERRPGKFLMKFVFPKNVNKENIKAVCQDGVLTITVEKILLPGPKRSKMIEINVG